MGSLPNGAIVKRCVTCKEEKPKDDFNKRSRAKDGFQDRCRSCCKAWYAANREKHKANVQAVNTRRRKRMKAWMREYLSDKACVDCGIDDLLVLEFDHIADDKRANVSRLLHGGHSLQCVTDEIAKCEVVCANCHRRRTALRGNWYRLESTPV